MELVVAEGVAHMGCLAEARIENPVVLRTDHSAEGRIEPVPEPGVEARIEQYLGFAVEHRA